MSPAEPSARDLLAIGLEALELEHPDPQALLDRLAALAEQLARWTARIDLTSHATPQAVVRGLLWDAMGLARVLPPVASLADLGSGAGIPGIPLALLRPELRVTLVDSRERRHHFQRDLVRRLKLAQVAPRRGRAERMAAEPHEAVIAQALGPPETAVPLMWRWVAPGGWLVLPLGSRERMLGTPEGLEARMVRYRRPGDEASRFVWLAHVPRG